MNINFKLTEVKPRIFFFDFKNRYDCNMFFLRYQEYYESPNSKFRGKAFELIDFMNWYSKAYGNGVFTYPVDWSGFNIPGQVVVDVLNLGITDKNSYDAHMMQAYQHCLNCYNDGNFYFIGSVGKGDTFNHEVAHGLFYTRPEYRKQMTALVKDINPIQYKSMCNTLKKMGYAKKVFVDECQAYLATGMSSCFKVKMIQEQKLFSEVFKKFVNC